MLIVTVFPKKIGPNQSQGLYASLFLLVSAILVDPKSG